MNNHYISRLLLRKFAEGNSVGSYDLIKGEISKKNIKRVFAGQDIFDPELERTMANKIEGPVGDLLNNRLLVGRDSIELDRRENRLLRKYVMLHGLRAPILNTSWEEMIRRTRTEDHPALLRLEFMFEIIPGFRDYFLEEFNNTESYLSNLKLALETDSLEELADFGTDVPVSLQVAACQALLGGIAFWDSRECEEEFVLPKLPGISMLDLQGPMYKCSVIAGLCDRVLPNSLLPELERLYNGGLLYSDNYTIYPISPYRTIIFFSPYFRAFFPIMDYEGRRVVYPPLLGRKQFDRHFFEPTRMELFEPCKSKRNSRYRYKVHQLKKEEVFLINSLILDMETEEFVFHDFEKIRDSLRYYDREAKLAYGKKHDFRSCY